ncbi:MAG: DUF3021 domain-containing protein [Clostridia bacterium]|nr:DUF3021 domain-containing protein [Clostridia bacterium]
MLKKMLSRALVSAPICMLINQLIGICVSLANADGRYSPVTPAFAARFPSDTVAVIVQLLLIGLVGATFAACSVIFEIERWSFLRQGLIHLAITSAVAIPVCLFCWLPESAAGAWVLVGSWLFTYTVTWLSQYLLYRHRVRALDAKIKQINGRDTK